MTQIIADKLIGKECRFAVYLPHEDYNEPDLHFVKEISHFKNEDGTITTKPTVRLIKNFQRSFWVTRKGRQNYKQKKEWCKLDDVIEGKSTQTRLVQSCAKALGMPWFKGNLRMLSETPYLYGADITSTAIIKRSYADEFPDLNTPYTVSVFDVETDVVNNTEQIIMASITFKDRIRTVVVKSFLEGITDVQNRVEAKMREYLGDLVDSRKLQCELFIVDNEIDTIRLCAELAHELKPDFFTIWNIDFDVTKLKAACDRAGVHPKDIFSDPIVPPEYRMFEYKQGKKQKITASGLVTPIKPAAQWHTVTCPASFYFIDAMCVYKQVRVGKQEEQSYSLDSILNKELGMRKLKFKEADHLSGLRWHQYMQTSFKIEYIIYNRFDCIGIELLDEKTNDLSVKLPMFGGCSDFANFNSQPRRMVDRLHFYCLSKGRVIATTSSKMQEDMDDETVGLSNWITALNAYSIVENGLCVIEEDPTMRTRIRMATGDLDVSAAYPSNQCVFNVSKETTIKELIDIEGLEEQMVRMQTINLSGGHTNAIEFCTYMMKFPNMFDLLQKFNQDERVIEMNMPRITM